MCKSAQSDYKAAAFAVSRKDWPTCFPASVILVSVGFERHLEDFHSTAHVCVTVWNARPFSNGGTGGAYEGLVSLVRSFLGSMLHQRRENAQGIICLDRVDTPLDRLAILRDILVFANSVRENLDVPAVAAFD